MDENLNNEELLDSENFEEQEDLEVETDENGLTETFGDENYENFIMPDGTMNFRYIEKLNILLFQKFGQRFNSISLNGKSASFCFFNPFARIVVAVENNSLVSCNSL